MMRGFPRSQYMIRILYFASTAYHSITHPAARRLYIWFPFCKAIDSFPTPFPPPTGPLPPQRHTQHLKLRPERHPSTLSLRFPDSSLPSHPHPRFPTSPQLSEPEAIPTG